MFMISPPLVDALRNYCFGFANTAGSVGPALMQSMEKCLDAITCGSVSNLLSLPVW